MINAQKEKLPPDLQAADEHDHALPPACALRHLREPTADASPTARRTTSMNPSAWSFLSAVPTVWDETKVLAAEVSDYVILARRNGDDWYVGRDRR